MTFRVQKQDKGTRNWIQVTGSGNENEAIRLAERRARDGYKYRVTCPRGSVVYLVGKK